MRGTRHDFVEAAEPRTNFRSRIVDRREGLQKQGGFDNL